MGVRQARVETPMSLRRNVGILAQAMLDMIADNDEHRKRTTQQIVHLYEEIIKLREQVGAYQELLEARREMELKEKKNG